MSLDDLRLNDFKTMQQSVFEKLREAILAGHFRPGQRLVERELAQAMQISRTPIREALRKLEEEKLVTNIPYRGVFVSEVTAETAAEVYQVRMALEGLAAALAAEKAAPEDLALLRGIMVDLEKASEKGHLDELIEGNNRFHATIAKLAGNQVLREILQTLQANIGLLRVTSLSVPGRPQATLEEHWGIYEAIAAQDVTLARELAAEHVRRAGEAAGKELTKRGEEG